MRASRLLFAAIPGVALAQTAPPVRLINAPDASTTPRFGIVAGVRELPNGGVLVNDPIHRQLIRFDASLGKATLVADSTSGSANSYGTRPGGLIPYRGDSTLFVDPAGLSMFVLDDNGAIARVVSVPRSQDATALTIGAPRLDARGRIVYRGVGGPRMISSSRGTGNGAGPMNQMAEPPDTAALVRIDPVSRKLDTAAFVRIPKNKMIVTQTDGRMSISMEINPLPTIDDWAVLSDGSIAIVRGRDYHIDWINADGSASTSPKMPFDWQRLSDEEKVAVIDSASAAGERARAGLANSPEGRGAVAAGMGVMILGGGGGRAMAITGGAGGLVGPQTQFVSPSELPDYRPAFSLNAALGDADGNLWIRTSAVRAGAVNAGPIYDVINRKGELTDRIQVPAGRSIVGFGRGGVVYMSATDDRGTWLERGKREAGNGERRTWNGERGTGNGERRTGNGERGTGNGERLTGGGDRKTETNDG